MYGNSLQPKKMQERYNQLPPQITELFDYGTVGLSIDNITSEFNLTERQKEALLMETELVLYLFLPRLGFIERLQESLEIDQSLAEQVASEIENNIFFIVNDLLDFSDNQFKQESGTPTTIPNAQPQTNNKTIITKSTNPPASEIIGHAEESAGQNIKPLRTFAEDVQSSRVHGYGAFHSGEVTEGNDSDPVHRSSQDDIIKRS